MELCEVIYKFPDDTSPIVMEDCVYYKHKDRIRKYLVEKMIQKKNEVREILKKTEKIDIIHRDITDNGTEKILISIKR